MGQVEVLNVTQCSYVLVGVSFKGEGVGGSVGERRQNCSFIEQVGAVDVLQKTTQRYEAFRFRKRIGDEAMSGVSRKHGCVEQ